MLLSKVVPQPTAVEGGARNLQVRRQLALLSWQQLQRLLRRGGGGAPLQAVAVRRVLQAAAQPSQADMVGGNVRAGTTAYTRLLRQYTLLSQ